MPERQLPSLLQCTPAGISWSRASQLAATVARRHRFRVEKDSIFELVKQLGGITEVVRPEQIEQLRVNSLEVYRPGHFLVRLSTNSERIQDRFHIAHELGHYFIHTGNPEGSVPITAGRGEASEAEREANRFAACLLMPEIAVRPYIEKMGVNAALVALYFKVQLPVAVERMASLGFVSGRSL